MDPLTRTDSPEVTLAFFSHVRSLLTRQDPSFRFVGMTGTGAEKLGELTARELGNSERTVSNEVREIGRRLGTSNRAHTIARICGAPL